MIGGLRRPSAPAHIALAAAGALLGVAAIGSALGPQDAHAAPASAPSLAHRLGAKTYAFALPTAWLAAPIPGVREEDILDVLGTRSGERATASEVANGLRVMSADERTLVVELTADDASAIASARARGLTLVLLLRSAK